MSWFNSGYSKKVIQREENKYIRRYGKVKGLSEVKEIDLLPIVDDPDNDEDKTIDENKDEKFDYSDLED